MFYRYSLRTTQLDAARKFYAEAIGLELPDGASATSTLEAWTLHERALAMGAPPHWLGHIAASDVEQAASRVVALGGERLGPTVTTRDGAQYATLRDPFGAVMTVRARAESISDSPVAWHQLHVREADRAWAMYSELFGWSHTETLDVPDAVGAYRVFAWSPGAAPVGAMANTARAPGVHPHWLFHFPVADVEACAKRVCELGGTAMGPFDLPGVGLLSACEDPQGAAFGLVSRP